MLEQDDKARLDLILGKLLGDFYIEKNEHQLIELEIKVRTILETIYSEEERKYLLNRILNLNKKRPKPVKKNIDIIRTEIEKQL